MVDWADGYVVGCGAPFVGMSRIWSNCVTECGHPSEATRRAAEPCRAPQPKTPPFAFHLPILFCLLALHLHPTQPHLHCPSQISNAKLDQWGAKHGAPAIIVATGGWVGG